MARQPSHSAVQTVRGVQKLRPGGTAAPRTLHVIPGSQRWNAPCTPPPFMVVPSRLAVAAITSALAFLGCTGPTGPDGAPGPMGASGAQGAPGAAGATGAQGPAGNGGGNADASVTALPTACMSPCHGFNGVVSQFKASVHYSAYVTNIGTAEADSWTSPGAACGNCHAIDALEQRAAGNVGTTNDGGVTSLANGQLEYQDPVKKTTVESTYAGNASVAEVYCTTCHAVTPATDPHRTGKTWTPGSFPLRVASGATDVSFIEKSASTTDVGGTSIGALGVSNTCVWCHKSRKDVTNYITASNVLTSTHWGPHEGPQADVFSAKGGYHFAGKTYGTSTHALKLACVDCHMPEVAENSAVGDHSFNAQLSACQNCHVGATSFDVNGGQSRIAAGMHELRAALNAAGYLTRSATPPYLPLAASELADGNFDLDQTRPGGGADGGASVLTADRAGALYDYIIVARGGASGVHNPKYTQQLVFDSYVAVTGLPPTSIQRPQ